MRCPNLKFGEFEMKLIAPDTGQSLQLAVMDEVTPLRGGIFLPDFLRQIGERYRFVTPPTVIDPQQPAKFQTGALITNDLTIPITSLEIYRDGVIVNATQTQDADLALDDFTVWAIARFSLREPITKIPRRYSSTVIVELDGSLNRFIRNFEMLEKVVSAAMGDGGKLEVTNLKIGPNPPGELPLRRTWLIEPRLGQPFVENRYRSAAPLSTEAHLELLSSIEAAII
jgi:hypothetical protein